MITWNQMADAVFGAISDCAGEIELAPSDYASFGMGFEAALVLSIRYPAVAERLLETIENAPSYAAAKDFTDKLVQLLTIGEEG